MKLVNLKGLKGKAAKLIAKSGLVLKKYSPEILLVIGATGSIVGAIVACKATPKATEAYYDFCDDLSDLHANADEKPAIKDTVRVYTRAGFRYVKVYAPAIAIIFGGIGCNVGSYLILHKRGVALAAALATTTTAFAEYRGRVAAKFGDEAEREIRLNVHEATVAECDNADDAAEIMDGDVKYTVTPAGYDRCFDEYNPMWTKSAIDNLNFLVQCQAYANEQLRLRGHLFVNELMDILHFKRVPEGQIDGWIYDESRDDLHNFIDLGLYSVKDIAHENFLRGMETSVWLTINPDGDILSLMR